MTPAVRSPWDDDVHHITLGDDTQRGPNERRALRRRLLTGAALGAAGMALLVALAAILAAVLR